MRIHIKKYADILFGESQLESGRSLFEATTNFGRQIASRKMTTPLPIGVLEIQPLMKLFAQHVERCIEARFESYRAAYSETKEVPTDAEFIEIWTSVQGVGRVQSQLSARAIARFAGTHSDNLDLSLDVLPMTVHGHGRILENLKAWQESGT